MVQGSAITSDQLWTIIHHEPSAIIMACHGFFGSEPHQTESRFGERLMLSQLCRSRRQRRPRCGCDGNWIPPSWRTSLLTSRLGDWCAWLFEMPTISDQNELPKCQQLAISPVFQQWAIRTHSRFQSSSYGYAMKVFVCHLSSYIAPPKKTTTGNQQESTTITRRTNNKIQ